MGRAYGVCLACLNPILVRSILWFSPESGFLSPTTEISAQLISQISQGVNPSYPWHCLGAPHPPKQKNNWIVESY